MWRSILVWIAEWWMQAATQRTIDASPAFMEYVLAKKIAAWAHANRDLNKQEDWIQFCMKRLRTSNTFKIFKSEIKKLKTFSGWCPSKGLPNETTLMQIQSGRTVPLTIAIPFNVQFFYWRAEAWSGEGRARAGGQPGGSGRGAAFQTQRLRGRELEEQRKVSWIFFCSLNVLATPLLMSPILYFWEMSGSAGALPTWPPVSLT